MIYVVRPVSCAYCVESLAVSCDGPYSSAVYVYQIIHRRK
jgi:hypothetical protein